MKKYLLTIAILINGLITFAQTPVSFQYQAVLRDASGRVLANQEVEIGIAILQGSASGSEAFTETHLVTTNNFGLANLQIGSVNPVGVETIDWSAGPYFVQVSVDGTIMGTSQLLSVPFAMHAVTVENDAVDDADSNPTNEIQDISLSGNELSITGGSTIVLPDEVNDADADPTNEIQVLSIKGDTVFLSDGGYALLPAETDPQFSAWDKSTGVAISESQITDLKHFTNADETDPVFDSSLAKQITESDTARWGNDSDPTNELQYLSISGDTIFLANGGFVKLPAETDPQFSAWDKSTGVVISESQITDLKHFTNSDETDPVFNSSLAKQITSSDTARWGIDSDPTNELQDINLNGTDLSISEGSTIDLSVIQDGTGTDTQLLGWQVNNQGDIKLHITNGNSVTLPFIREEVDGDSTNELNTSVVLNVADLEVTDAGGTITTDLSSLIDDADADPANELNKSVDLNGTDLEVTDAGGTITTDLSSLIDDADADPGNELNTRVVLNGTDLEVTDAGGTITTDLSSLIDDADADPTNELNTSVVLNGTDLEVTDAGGTLTTDLSSLIDDADADPTNELNTSVVLNGTDLEVTDAGGTKSANLSSLNLSWGNLTNVPAGFADDVDNVNDTDADPSNEIQNLSSVLSQGNSANSQIKNLTNPTDDQDAATKAYVDALLIRIEALEENYLFNGFIDERDGNHYNVAKIGNQVWMAENLKYLPSVVGPATSSQTTPYYYVYGYDGISIADAKAAANYTTYGVLYNWPAAMDGSVSSTSNPSGVQGVCPTGWHLPSMAEWGQLMTYLGGTSNAGGKLKETGTTHWDSPNTGATNETGFTAIPGGCRDYNFGTFDNIGLKGVWWSATALEDLEALNRYVSYNISDAGSVPCYKKWGYSVRCVRD